MVAHTEYTAPLTHRNWFLWGLKACLSTLLLLWALHKVPMANLLEALRTAHPAWVLALAHHADLTCAARPVSSSRWARYPA